MMSDFVWFLPEAGQQLLELETDDPPGDRRWVPWILPAEVPDKTMKRCWRRYTPLRSHAALFRTFADVECSQASIMNFANNYGLLTDPLKGESLPKWKAAIAEMRSAVECWEAQRLDTTLLLGKDSVGKTEIVAKHLLGTFQEGAPAHPAVDLDVAAQPLEII